MNQGRDPADPDYEARLAVEAQRWSELGRQRYDRTNWLHSRIVLQHINARITGHADVSWHETALAHFLPRPFWGGLGLALGCNDSGFERAIVRTGVCARLDGYDLSPAAVAGAAATALAEGLPMHFHVADVNTLELPPDRYALATVIMALHHFERLEHVCGQVHRALRPDGLFAFDEFVGPTRFQWTKDQVDAANELRRRLPPQLRRLPDGSDVGDVQVPELERMRRDDPFEAIRSEEILPIVRDTFRVLTQRDYGGTVLHLALQTILANFDEQDPEHAAILQAMCDQEWAWLSSGQLPSDFTVVIACRKDAPVARFPIGQ